ncbi:MAG: hypothetical protein ABGZ17_30115 [Planctomycetaceae bacterium]
MNTPTDVSRRRFLQNTPAAGTLLASGAVAAATGTSTGAAAQENRNPRKTLRVGALNISVYSHLAAHWARLMNGPMSYTGMRITHCWDINPAAAAGFARGNQCHAVDDFDGMLGQVDAVIDGGYYNHAFNHVLMAPYLRAGLPCLINRPFANSLSRTQSIVDLARKHKAPLLVPSAFGHNQVVAEARHFAESSTITGYHATTGAEDYPTHGTHGLYFLSRAITDAGNPIVSVAFRARDWHTPPGVLTLEHQDKQGRTFYGTLHSGNFGVGMLQIHTEQQGSGRPFTLTLGRGEPYKDTEFWAPTLWAFQQMATSRQMPQSYDQILMKQQAYLAGFRSQLVEQGQPVRLDDVPADWEAPVKLPQRPGEAAYFERFQKQFG